MQTQSNTVDLRGSRVADAEADERRGDRLSSMLRVPCGLFTGFGTGKLRE
ncbi:MAG: hypothetical protein GDA43_08750 [Hormoscilla sp. SP5CHS1]|nr:hypothetical protein [Hormoscilla sp. SP12CHS1]MBC6453287.1 hypothetical protein [Hormoscilla sp. SP5CHS1]